MFKTPHGMRLHIAVLGRVNSGKSSLVNLLTGEGTSIVSEIEGTTTDVVVKAQELQPIGPVLWLDTAGFADTTELSDKRMEKTLQAIEKTDIALIVCEGDQFGDVERKIVFYLEEKKIPFIVVFNKADLYKVQNPEGAIVVSSRDPSSRDRILTQITQKIIEICPEDLLNQPPLLSDLAPKESMIIMVVPIDYEAPKGRLILPQVQAIRDCLDANQMILVVKETEYEKALNSLKEKPALVVCDSSVVGQIVKQTPQDILLTTFSILMARLKGDLVKMTQGALKISRLQDGDRILIAESCTHHAAEDDIGRVKIPRLLQQKTGKTLIIDHVSGCAFPPYLEKYQLIIQCGGCTQNRKAILSKIAQAIEKNVEITNYGICISELNGVLERVLTPFPKALAVYKKQKL